MHVWIKSLERPGLAPAQGVFGQSKSKTWLRLCNLWQGFPLEERKRAVRTRRTAGLCALVSECELNKGLVGACPSEPSGPARQWIHPHPFEKFSVCTELSTDPPGPKLSCMLLAGLVGVEGAGEWKCFGSLRVMQEALWFLVYVNYSGFQNDPKHLTPLSGP